MESLQQDFPDDFARVDNVLCPGDRCKGQPRRKGAYVDEWGCGWECGEDGVVGEVKFPPLAKWKALDSFKAPWEVIQRADWDVANCAQEQNLAGENKFLWTFTGIRPFERMQFLRGSENLYMDIGYDSAEFRKLLEMVHEYYLEDIRSWCKSNVDGVFFMDDWGSNNALLISPDSWRKIFKPLYKEYCDIIGAAGKFAFFHSDGHIKAIYEDLIEIGVNAVNSQLFCMDIEQLAEKYKGSEDRHTWLGHGNGCYLEKKIAIFWLKRPTIFRSHQRACCVAGVVSLDSIVSFRGIRGEHNSILGTCAQMDILQAEICDSIEAIRLACISFFRE